MTATRDDVLRLARRAARLDQDARHLGIFISGALFIHDVPRDIFDSFDGPTRDWHPTDGRLPWWSRTIVVGKSHVTITTSEPPTRGVALGPIKEAAADGR